MQFLSSRRDAAAPRAPRPVARPANDEAPIDVIDAELTREICGRGRLVRRQLAKLIQAGSIPVVRSKCSPSQHEGRASVS